MHGISLKETGCLNIFQFYKREDTRIRHHCLLWIILTCCGFGVIISPFPGLAYGVTPRHFFTCISATVTLLWSSGSHRQIIYRQMSNDNAATKILQTLGTCSVFFKSYGSLLKNSRTSQLLAMYFGFYTLTGNSSLGVYSPEWVQNILYPKYTKKWFSKILYITYELRILCLMGTHHMCF